MLEGAVFMLIGVKCMCFLSRGCRLLPYSDHKKNAETFVFSFSYLYLWGFFSLNLRQQAAKVLSKFKAFILLLVFGFLHLISAGAFCKTVAAWKNLPQKQLSGTLLLLKTGGWRR